METKKAQVAVIPFAVQQVDVRVLPSPIGPVVPLVDVAAAIGYDRETLSNLYSRNKEAFEGTSRVVTTLEVSNNRGVLAEQNRHMLSFNVYGVVGLLMKLDYNRIQDGAKRNTVLRFQRWAMATLGNALASPAPAQKQVDRSRKMVLAAQPMPQGVSCITCSQAAKQLGMYRTSIHKMILRGELTGYRATHRRGGSCWAIPVDQVKAHSCRIGGAQ